MISDTQRQLRRGLIGSSDAAAICGLDPYRTAYDVWATATGKVAAFSGNNATDVGTYMERGIVDWVEAEIGKPINRDVMVTHADGIRGANLDGLCQAGPLTIVEAKTCGVVFPTDMRDQYGEPEEGMEGVPQHVIIQTHHQAAVVEPTYGPVQAIITAALIGYRGLVRYRFEPDRKLIDAVAEKIANFHQKHIKTDTPPDDWPTSDVAKALPRIAGKTVDVPTMVMEEFVRTRAAAKAAAEILEASKGRLIAALGDAEVGRAASGIVTYKEIHRAEYTVKPSSFRQLNFKAARR